MITAVYLSNPFKPQSRVMKPFAPEEAQTLNDVMQAFKIESPEGWLFSVNGKIINAPDAKETRLSAMDFVVIIPKVQGGGGGKNIGALIGAIAIMALTGGAGGGVLGGLLGGGMGGTLGLGLALYLGGSLLMGNQKIPKIDTPDYSYSAMEGGYGWSPDQIQVRPGTPIPITYGSVRTSGQLIGRRITSQIIPDTLNNVQFLYLLLACNDGELDSISDIKVNDVAISSIANAYSETRLGTNDQTAVTNILTSVQEQQAFNHELPTEVAGTNWVTKTTTEYGNQIELEFVYPAGSFWLTTDTGAQVAVWTSHRIQYREVGGSTWTDLVTGGDLSGYGDLHLNTRKPHYFKQVFSADPTKLYEFRAQNYTLTYYNTKYGWAAIPGNTAMNMNWLSMTVLDYTNERYPNTALVALGIPASENLSGSMPKVSWTQTRSNIWAYNPTAAAYQQKDATNIAWMIYDLIHQCRRLYNTRTFAYEYVVQGEPAANLDYDTFDAWATWCAETVNGTARAKGNLLVDSAAQLWPSIQKIAASARGYVIQQAGVFKPVWDQATTMTQIFTSGNIIEGSISGGFLPERERATAIEASFLNEDNGYGKDTMLVTGEDYNPADLDNPTQVFFPGLTNSNAVYMAAKHLIKKNKFLKRTISFQADIDSIVAQIGDVVGVQSDITSWGVGGRVMGATTTQIVIDQDVTLQPGTTYSILVRGSDDTLTRKTVDAVTEETYTQTLNFTGDPFTTAPTRYDLYAFGVSTLETKPFQITSIKRNGDLQATIEGIEYIEGVFTDSDDFPVINYTTQGASINSLTVNADADTGKLGISWAIPSDKDYTGCIVFVDGQPQGFFTSETTSTDVDATPGSHTVSVLPIDGTGKAGTEATDTVALAEATLDDVSSISLNSEVVIQTDGTSLVYITGSFTKPDMAVSTLVEIGEGGSPTSWATVQEASIEELRYGPVKPGTTYTFRFTAKNKFAASTPITDSVLTTGDSEAPNAPSIGASSYLKTVTILISLATVPSDLAGFKVYRNTIDSSVGAEQIGSVSSKDGRASYTDEAPEYGKTYYYFARSFDTWGNLSAYSGSDSALISSINSTDLVDGALNRSELFQAGVVDAAAIGEAAVTAVKTDLAAINAASGELNANTVNELQLAADAVTEAKIAADAVNTAQINNAALKNPLGAVASWSAKNCTAADIAEVGGVRDVSGNGNHGVALGGVEVVDSEMGKAFSFGAPGASIVLNTPIGADQPHTLMAWVNRSDDAATETYRTVFAVGTGNTHHMLIAPSWAVCIFDGSVRSFGYTLPDDGKMHRIVIVFNSSTSASLYADGSFINTIAINLNLNTYPVGRIGNWSAGTYFCDKIVDPRIYNRALTESEIKTLYMFPEDAAFGNITADLVTTGELITRTAQIGEAVITSAQIKELDAGKIQSGYLSGDRIDAGTLAADTIIGGALVIGSAAGDVNAGTTTVNGDKITASSITSGKIGAGEIKAVNIEAGTITGEKIAADTITTRELLIGNPGSALNDDPNVVDETAWQGGTPTFTTVTDGKVGNNVMRHTGSSQIHVTKKIVIDREKTYRVRLWVRSLATNSTNRFYFRIGSWGSHTTDYVDIWNGFPGTDWEEHYAIIEGSNMPTGTEITPVIIFALSGTVEREVQDVRIEEVLPATLIKDGAIITDKLAANAVVAGKIDSGAIEARHIKANEITADKLNIGTITEIDANAALISDIITSYTDLTNKPTLGDVAALNSITSTYIENGAVITAKIAAGAITTSELNVAALKAPAGEVAAWSAKGSTAASIALADGVKDVSGNGNHGQAFGGVAVVDTDIGKGFRFAGDNDTINFDATPFRGATAFTVTMWIKTAGLASGMTKNGYWSNQYIPYADAASDGKMRFVCQNGAGVTAVATDTASHFDDTWHHFAFVANGATIKIFKDSVEVASADCVGITWPIYGIPFYLGRNANNLPFYGKFDCVGARQYNRALTAAEVKTLYMLGTDQESGVITADRVVTGELKSLNYSTTAGSMFDLDAGDLKLGGSSAPKFSFTTSTNTCTLAGFTIDADDLTAGSGSTAIGISTDTAKRAFWAGSTTPTSAPFQVEHDGTVTATTGTIAGYSLASSGFQGNWYQDASNYSVSTISKSVDSSSIPTFYASRTISGITTSVTVAANSGTTTSTALIKAEADSSSDYGFYTNASIYIGNNCSALSFTDRTEMPETVEEAKEIINSMQQSEGKLDYNRFSRRGKHFAVKEMPDKSEEIEEGRNLTKTVSALAMLVNDLQEQLIRTRLELADLRGELTDEECDHIKRAENASPNLKAVIAPHVAEIMRRLKE